MPLSVQTRYMRNVFNDVDSIIKDAHAVLLTVDFDTVIGTGLSGSLVVPLLGRGLGKHWSVVRKPNDGSHSRNRLEGTIGDRWIFVDDIIATGATLNRVRQAVVQTCAEHDHTSEYVGAYVYQTLQFWISRKDR